MIIGTVGIGRHSWSDYFKIREREREVQTPTASSSKYDGGSGGNSKGDGIDWRVVIYNVVVSLGRGGLCQCGGLMASTIVWMEGPGVEHL